jgi:hypothetical protein
VDDRQSRMAGGTIWVCIALSAPPGTGQGDAAGFKSPFSVESAAKDS